MSNTLCFGVIIPREPLGGRNFPGLLLFPETTVVHIVHCWPKCYYIAHDVCFNPTSFCYLNCIPCQTEAIHFDQVPFPILSSMLFISSEK